MIFSPEDRLSRKNLWRSIFVIDRLLSCSLGRPTAISQDDCSGDSLHPSGAHLDPPCSQNMHNPAYNEAGPCALEATVRSCSVISVILKVYQQRNISTRRAQEIADICKAWAHALPDMLHWRQAANASPSQGVAILHVNLFYCHSIILLTRPFLLHILNLDAQRQINQTATRSPRPYLRMERFSEACVIASTHTVMLVQHAFEAGCLSRRNPAVIYFLFAATLVVLANEFSALYRVDGSDLSILNAINVMNYCAESDQQAARLVCIVSAFRDVVTKQRAHRKKTQPDNNNLPSISSQLYGTPMNNQQQSSNAGGLATSTDPLNATSRLHQVPVHIYPGMETAPLSSSSTTTFQAPHPQASQPPSDFSVHLSPIQDPAVSAAGSDFFGGRASRLHSPSQASSLANMLDLSALDGTRVPSVQPEDSGQDENIDFDALWAWNTPAMGSPREGQGDGNAVPMVGVSAEGGEL